jgi:hypothetical protein
MVSLSRLRQHGEVARRVFSLPLLGLFISLAPSRQAFAGHLTICPGAAPIANPGAVPLILHHVLMALVIEQSSSADT